MQNKKHIQEEMTYLLGCDVNLSRNDPLNCGSHFTTRRGSYSDMLKRVGWKEAENLEEAQSNHRTYQLWQSLYSGASGGMISLIFLAEGT